MANALEEQAGIPDVRSLSFEDRLGLLVEREYTSREDRRLTRLLQLAKLRLPAALEDIDFRRPRGLDKSVVLRLASCAWIEAHEVVLVSGATGTGRSYLACALGHYACRHGHSTRYYRFSRMLGELAHARADGSHPKLLEKLARTQLLIIDDFGLSPLTDNERRDLLEVGRSYLSSALRFRQVPTQNGTPFRRGSRQRCAGVVRPPSHTVSLCLLLVPLRLQVHANDV